MMTATPEKGLGERADAQRRARSRLVMMASAVFAAGIIAVSALSNHPGQTMAPWGAIGVTLLYLTAFVGVGWAAKRFSDEVELRDTHRGLSWAALCYILIYPGWYFLWCARLVPEPSHEILFLGVLIVAMLVYLRARLA